MVCAIFKQKRLDCVPLVLCICNFMDFIRITATSHTIQSQYTGQGLILLENEELRDTEGKQIDCTLGGEPYATITWKWKDGQTPAAEHYFSWTTSEIPTDPKLSSSTLGFSNFITETQKRDIKTRTIYAIGAHSDDPSKTKQCDDVILSFIWKPEGTPSLSINKDPLVFGEDSTAQLTCQLIDKGNPEGQVRWIKNGNLQSETEYNTQNISIPVTKDINNDKWQCYYYNTAGDGDYSDEVMINVHWKPLKPALTINKETFVIGEDSTARLTCQLTDKGNPEGQVRWIKNGNLQSESEYSTEIISIPVTKDVDGDKWQCYYYNTAGDGDYSDEVMINVHWKPLKPSLSKSKETFVIGEDSTAQLACQLIDKGNPEGQVRWIKNGNLQSESEYSTEIISIPVTKDIDDDKWQCYYYNTAGDGDYSEEVLINVHWKPEKPSLSIDKETFVIGKDTEAQLTCQLIDKGNPEGQVRWIKNGNLQSESEYSTEIISIPVTKDIDDDKWQCYYFNTAGDGDYSDEVLINVHWSPGGATISADTQTPKRDDTFTFTCTGDRGNPPGRVLWYLSGTMVANTTNNQYTVTDAKESHNGNWSCIFSNYLKSGAQSQSIQIQVQLTPEQGEVRITSITARNVVVNVTPKINTQKARRSIRSTTITNMIITWYSDNDKNNTVLVPPDTTQYALYNLTANTNYTIEVSYVNDQGIGAAATAYVTTKALPLNIDPIITRSWLSAIVTLDIANPGSVAQVEMLVCVSVEDINCVNNSINDVQTGNLEAKISSINGRYVIVSLYDEGFLISMFSDNIDAPVLAITLIALGTLLVVGVLCVVIIVVIRKTRTSTPTEKSKLYENVGADKRSVTGGVNNVNATPDYEYGTHNAASTSNNTESSTYMGLDQTSLQRTKERATELTVYQSLN